MKLKSVLLLCFLLPSCYPHMSSSDDPWLQGDWIIGYKEYFSTKDDSLVQRIEKIIFSFEENRLFLETFPSGFEGWFDNKIKREIAYKKEGNQFFINVNPPQDSVKNLPKLGTTIDTLNIDSRSDKKLVLSYSKTRQILRKIIPKPQSKATEEALKQMISGSTYLELHSGIKIKFSEKQYELLNRENPFYPMKPLPHLHRNWSIERFKEQVFFNSNGVFVKFLQLKQIDKEELIFQSYGPKNELVKWVRIKE